MSAQSDQSAPARDKSNAPCEPARLFGKAIVAPERMDIRRAWPILFLIVAAMLAFRQPYALIHPYFYAEDGAVFFKQQYEMGFAPALVTRYAGYPHFAPRILAGLCSVAPIECLPLAYTIASLLVAAGTLTFFFAPGFRPIINSDSLRACLVLLFTLMPNADPLMKLADVNWYMVMFTSLVVLYSLPQRRLTRWLLFLLAALATWSNPTTVAFAPAMLYRAWKAGRDKTSATKAQVAEEHVWWKALALLTIAFAFVVEKQPGTAKMILHEQAWMVAMYHSIGYRVFCFFFLGPMLMYPPLWGGWGIVGPLALVFAAACVGAAVWTVLKARKPETDRFAPLVMLYLIFALPALFVLRKSWQKFFLSWSVDAWQENDRYFLSSTLLLCILLGVVYERLYRPWMIRKKLRCELSLLVLGAWLILQGFGFRMDAWHKKTPWSVYAKKIHLAESSARRTGHYESVSIPGSPAGWDFELMIAGSPAAQ